MINKVKSIIPDDLKKILRQVEKEIKYPFRKARAAWLRNRVILTWDSSRFVAHRGLSAAAPENTMKAFELAAREGFAAIETDIRRTKDHKLVLMHDENLKRMCGVDALVRDLTYEELLKIPVRGSSTERIPLLSQFLLLCRDHDKVPMLELKDNWNVKEALPEDYLMEVIRQVGQIMGNRPVIYVSFNINTLLALQALLYKEDIAHVKLFHLVHRMDPSRFSWYKDHRINLSFQGKRNKLGVIRKAKEAGLELVVWVVDDPDQIRLYVRERIDWIASNDRIEVEQAHL